jgi:phosphoglycerate dehydrogenase-like enzyme
MRIAIAVHDPPGWILPATEVDRLRASLPGDVVADARDPAARTAAFAEADVIVTTWLTDAEAERLGPARWVHSTAVGVDNIVRHGLGRRGIIVTNSRGVHAAPIAEHAIALVLALRRGLHIARDRQRERVWAQEELIAGAAGRLSEACLLVVGLGAIGALVAAHAKALGMRVIGVRRRVDLPAPPGVDEVLPASRLRDALPRADAVVLALPGTRDTRALIGRDELAAMKPSGVLVNVARGQLVDEPALAEALAGGRLAGAALDTLTVEPPPADSPFWRRANVLLTPHVASFETDYWPPVVDLFLDNLARLRRGEPLRNVVDQDAGY